MDDFYINIYSKIYYKSMLRQYGIEKGYANRLPDQNKEFTDRHTWTPYFWNIGKYITVTYTEEDETAMRMSNLQVHEEYIDSYALNEGNR